MSVGHPCGDSSQSVFMRPDVQLPPHTLVRVFVHLIFVSIHLRFDGM